MLVQLITFIALQYTTLGVNLYHGQCAFNVYRYWHGAAGDHFYTQFPHEIGVIIPGQAGRHGYVYEGTQFKLEPSIADEATEKLYRYWNGASRDHFYTTNAAEIGTTTPGQVGKHGYAFEGIVGKCYKSKIYNYLIPLYRYWNPTNTDHFYTTNAAEIGTTTPGQKGNHGYISEGITCWVVPPNWKDPDMAHSENEIKFNFDGIQKEFEISQSVIYATIIAFIIGVIATLICNLCVFTFIKYCKKNKDDHTYKITNTYSSDEDD